MRAQGLQSLQSSDASSSLLPALGRVFERRWKRLTLFGLVLASTCAAAAWWQYRPTYRATACLRIDPRPNYLAFSDPRDQQSDSFLQTQIELIRGPLVTERVVVRPEIALLEDVQQSSSPAEWLAKRLSVQQLGQSELVDISLDLHDPQAAAKLVNAVLSSYSDLLAEDVDQRSRRTIDLLEREKGRRLTDLETLRAEVRVMVERQPELLTRRAGEGVGSSPSVALQQRLIAAEVEREILAAELQSEKEALASPVLVSEGEIEQGIEERPQFQKLNDVVLEKETQLAQAKAVAAKGTASPLVEQLAQEVKLYQQKLADLREQLRPAAKALLERHAQQKTQADIVRLQGELAQRAALAESLKKQFEAVPAGDLARGVVSLDYERAKTELDRAEAIFQQISNRAENLKTEIRAPARASVVRRAKVPTRALDSQRNLKFAGVTVVGFLLPFALAVFLEQRSRRIREADQIQQYADVAVVGEVSLAGGQRFRRGRPVATRRRRARQVFDESIDALRTRLLLSDDFGHLQVLAVVSAASGEGKTRLATHLAMSLARSSGQRTLLVEADLRAPQMHKRFDIAHGIGLIDVLTGRCSADEAIVSNLTRSFDVLPAGKLTADPHALFGGEQFQRLLAELKTTYRYIVLDTPPLLAASEALVLSKMADGALLCAMQDVSCTPQLKLAYERLLASGTNVVGAVLNGVPVRRYVSLYGDYRYPPVADTTELLAAQREPVVMDDVEEREPPALSRPK